MIISSLTVQIIHLLTVVFVTSLPFITNKYDIYYIIGIFCVILHWNIFNGECILSYFEKKLIDSNYNFGDIDGSVFKNILGIETSNALIYSNLLIFIFVLYRNYGKPVFKTMIIFLPFICVLFIMSKQNKFKKMLDFKKTNNYFLVSK